MAAADKRRQPRRALIKALRRYLPRPIDAWLSEIRQGLKRARVLRPTGRLDPARGKRTFVLPVGPWFDQNRPDAMMVARMGYCHAFEDDGIPYVIADIRAVADLIERVPDPFLMYAAEDVSFLPWRDLKRLRCFPSAVWTPPLFGDSDRFFTAHGLDAHMWALSRRARRKILALEPRFCFTATVPSGLGFFEGWTGAGVPAVVSLPLACDTRLYRPDAPRVGAFDAVRLAFVGGYWPSKGKQIDRYLRRFEDELVVYGYSRWPYRGYAGQMAQDGSEASLYRQACVCPVVNEPSVALLKGQINERVFKVLGSMGCPVVDAVPAYRELYDEDELVVAEDEQQFAELVNQLLEDEALNHQFRLRGHQATMSRHTYAHRAREFLARLMT